MLSNKPKITKRVCNEEHLNVALFSDLRSDIGKYSVIETDINDGQNLENNTHV